MASNMEPVAVSSQKQDIAWKHCQMLKNGDKVHLKCIYCDKIFKGGGIHRIKEHLAGLKGNAATCLKVHPDVRLQMLNSINGAALRKRKKQKPEEGMPDFDNPSGIDGLDTETVVPDQNTDLNNETREDSEEDRTDDRKKKGIVGKESDIVNSNMNGLEIKDSKKMVHMAIGRFLIDVGLPMDSVNSTYFQPMIDAIASQGPGAVGPSYHDLRSWILKNSVHEVGNDVDRCRESWGKTGCSILVNESNSGKGKTFVNFFVYCPEGTIFLRSADISDSPDVLYDLLRETVEEVGLRNVVQVITTSEDRYVVAGRRLMETIPTVFWTPCAGQCIDLMLEDIRDLPSTKTVLEQAKSISRYMYTNSVVLNMMRRHTCGVELIDLGNTRASTDFMTLKRMVSIRQNLQSMITSEEWMHSPYAKKSKGYEVLDYITNQSFGSMCSSITRIVDPLLRLFRIVGSGKMPAMGYIYAGLYRAKETIKKELVNREEYLVYWNIIDHRWDQLQGHPLHAAGFYFNPKYHYSLKGDSHLHVRSLVYDCIEKLVPDAEFQDKIMKETASYLDGHSDFALKLAVHARDNLLPTECWLTHGGGCPNLARLAIRILSQNCSLSQSKRNHTLIEQLHERKNCLEQQRLRDLVFVHYNMAVEHTVSVDKRPVDPIAYENIDVVEDWVMDNESCSEDPGNFDWKSVDPPLGNVALLSMPVDDIEALGAGFDDYEVFGGVRDDEEENDDEIIQGR